MNNITIDPKIDTSWKEVLSTEFTKEYFFQLKSFLIDEQKNHRVFPKNRDIFNAYNTTPFHKVTVVILGQDPYHGLNQAHGLSFSVNDGIKHPPSLQNILKELHNDIGCSIPRNGNLTKWAKQGVLLLNVVLSVREAEAASHQNRGWEHFTDATRQAVSRELSGVVFILWGKPAQMKERLIDSSKHLILKAPHPSPLSSYRGFFGSKPFSKTNDYLVACGKAPIDWCLS